MALTRKLLKGMGLTDEQVDTIIEAHTDTVDGLKGEITRYKTDAEALPNIQKELEKAKADLEAAGKDSWKVKYDAVKEEFEGYKTAQTQKEAKAAKESAYRELLKATGVSEKRIDAILRVTDLEAMEMADGALKDADKLTETIKTEWADFIGTTGTQGAPTQTPPPGAGGSQNDLGNLSMKDYIAARQKKG